MSLMNNANKLVDAAIGKDHSGTTLEDFLSKFNSPEGKFVDTAMPTVWPFVGSGHRGINRSIL